MIEKNVRNDVSNLHLGHSADKVCDASPLFHSTQMDNVQGLSKMLADIKRGWHKYQFLKYEYLETGCINEKVKKELNQKKRYHQQKYGE
ncbi:hypothetical protein NLX67_03160 [Domibacillus sp. A3M-37]|uniref:hypothetical protein n=1 Tax=Domibacillus sp. A3M-37 TaxID=2962037 RepID=UPI0020B74CCB|nr:hypothetical protein [Domibacillus sp. A3M-37]MCP3761389.1 hypothetical protein [Domibacillus sp. A3M-37]